MHAAEPTQLALIMERVARVKWTVRNVWLRNCTARRCNEHTWEGSF